MDKTSDMKTSDLLDLTTDIVTAYISHNDVAEKNLPDLIETIFRKLHDLSDPRLFEPERPKPVPAISVEESITEDFIFSLEDGQPYKSLKRHLKARYGMSPDDYREKWDLPPDYPMVAPGYAKERSKLAKKSGLGKNREDER